MFTLLFTIGKLIYQNKETVMMVLKPFLGGNSPSNEHEKTD